LAEGEQQQSNGPAFLALAAANEFEIRAIAAVTQ
jgi:hypothetical protein